MVKRIKYVSRYSRPLDAKQLEALGEAAAEKNRSIGVTGVLMASGGLFYQVIEGPAEAVDGLYAAIMADERHTDLVLLSVEDDAPSRFFPDWSMKMVNLDAASHVRLLPLKVLMTAVFEQRRLVDNMVWAIERTLKHEMREAE
jgi:hypothetical protein